MFGFGQKKDMKQLARESKRETRKTQRTLDREMRDLERNEKTMEAEIRKAAKQGNMKGAKLMAKQVVAARNQKDKLLQAKSTVGAVNMRAQQAATTATMIGSLSNATKVMAKTNAAMDPGQIQKTMMAFQQETAKMEMTQEMIDDALIDEFDASDEEEEDLIVNQVLDEIGIDLAGQMKDAPTTALPGSAQAVPATSLSDEGRDLLAQLEAL
jgi:charged multivesicular body protein 2B